MKRIILLILLSLSIFTPDADAHRLQPAYLEISEQNAGKFSILWKRPFVGSMPMNIYPQIRSCLQVAKILQSRLFSHFQVEQLNAG
jgi:hypothetical protein